MHFYFVVLGTIEVLDLAVKKLFEKLDIDLTHSLKAKAI